MTISLSVATTMPADGVAPLIVYFDASTGSSSSIGLDSFHDIEYFWDFGETGLGNWSYGVNTDKNKSKGPRAAHCYETPGTYTVTCKAQGVGETTVTQTVATIVVGDPATATGWTTVCVNKVGDSDFSAKPTGATTANYDTVNAAATALGNVAKRRILFKGGSTFGSDVAPNFGVSAVGGIVGSYGTGKAIWSMTSSSSSGFAVGNVTSQSDDWRFMDLAIRNPSQLDNAQIATLAGSNRQLWLRIDTLNCLWFHGSDTTGISDYPTTLLHDLYAFVECTLLDCVGYQSTYSSYISFLAGVSKTTVLGSFIQGPQADHGANIGLNHHTRWQCVYNSVVANSRWEYGVAQSGGSNYHNTLFFHGDNTPHGTDKNHIYDTELDITNDLNLGAGVNFGPENTSPGTVEYVTNTIFDSCFLTDLNASNTNSAVFGPNTAQTATIRNCVAYVKGTVGSGGMPQFNNGGGDNPNSDHAHVVNNTFYIIGAPDQSHVYMDASVLTTEGLLANNLYYVPGTNTTRPIPAVSSPSSVNMTAENNTADDHIYVDPLFANSTGTFSKMTDFRLGGSSYALALGTTSSAGNVHSQVDASGAAFPSTARSLGAFQSTSGYPSNTAAPVVSGTATVGSVLSVTNGSWSPAATGYTYQWQRNGTNIGAATSNSYTLVSGDGGFNITCIVTATNASGSGSATSNAIGPITGGPVPSNTAAPFISGSPGVGEIASVTNGSWNNSPTSYSYQWRRNGTNISGATSSTYTLVLADYNDTIDCLVTATNVSGSSTPADSNSFGPIGILARGGKGLGKF